MSRRRSNVAEFGLPDPVFVWYPGSDAAASSIKYIVCLNGRVPERYEVWSLNAQEVREVHPIARVKLLMPLRKILFGVLSSIREDAVFHPSVEDPSTVVSSLSASPASLRTVIQTSSLPEISSWIPGENILLWLVRLAPSILAERMFPLLVRRAST